MTFFANVIQTTDFCYICNKKNKPNLKFINQKLKKLWVIFFFTWVIFFFT